MSAALPILMYHHVSPSPGLVTVSPSCFREHMAKIAREGWQTIGVAELERFFAGEPLPRRSVMITFDDGYLDNFIHAHPVLQEFGLKAVLFLVTGWPGSGPVRQGTQVCPDHGECKRMIATGEADRVIVRWSEVEVMQAAGSFEFHSHTHSHRRWDRELPQGAERCAALAADLVRSRETLSARLGHGSRHLCWPQGYFEPDYLAVAASAGFDHLYTTEPTVNRLGGDAQHIGRVVTKEKSGAWLGRRLGIYASPLLGDLYSRLRGRR